MVRRLLTGFVQENCRLAISKYSPELVKYSRSHFSSIRHVTCLIADAVKVVGMCFWNLVSLTYRSSFVAPELGDMLWWSVNLLEFRLENVLQIDAEQFDALCLPHLRVLSLKGTICGDEKVNAIIQTTIGLQKIEFGNNIFVDGQRNDTSRSGLSSIEHLTQYSASILEELHATGLPSVRIGVCSALLQKCTHLHSLSLDCDLNPHCAEVVPHMSNLHKLVIYSLLSDKVLSLIAQHCKKLRKLGMYPHSRYQDDVINLEERVMYCANEDARWDDRLYTAAGLLALMDGLPLLCVLGVDHRELKEGELTTFAQRVCQRLRPQLVFEHNAKQLAFDVLLG